VRTDKGFATACVTLIPYRTWNPAVSSEMRLTVNGRLRSIEVAPDATLLSVLRDQLHLTGAKPSCERGECGACTVLLNSTSGDDGSEAAPEPIYACLALALAHEGDSITTIEGLASGNALHPLQTAFIARDAVQCGFCTPGQVLAGVALLARDPDPSDEEITRAMSGNLCRCGTYPKIVHAIRDAAAAIRGSRGN
jgi:xanthine dehydrogenase YagT iron-sulfur-binding subunit